MFGVSRFCGMNRNKLTTLNTFSAFFADLERLVNVRIYPPKGALTLSVVMPTMNENTIRPSHRERLAQY